MEIINRRHEEIFANQRVKLSAFFKVEGNRKSLYFSAGAALQFGIIPGLRINFINDEGEWMFYCDGNKDGFLLIGRKNKNSALICDAHLANLFLKRTKTSPETKFPITLTKSEINKNPIFKININKPLE